MKIETGFGIQWRSKEGTGTDTPGRNTWDVPIHFVAI